MKTKALTKTKFMVGLRCEKKLFFDHVHRIRKVSDIISDFPDCKVIGMTRDPRPAHVSGVEHWRRHHVQASNPSHSLIYT